MGGAHFHLILVLARSCRCMADNSWVPSRHLSPIPGASTGWNHSFSKPGPRSEVPANFLGVQQHPQNTEKTHMKAQHSQGRSPTPKSVRAQDCTSAEPRRASLTGPSLAHSNTCFLCILTGGKQNCLGLNCQSPTHCSCEFKR